MQSHERGSSVPWEELRSIGIREVLVIPAIGRGMKRCDWIEDWASVVDGLSVQLFEEVVGVVDVEQRRWGWLLIVNGQLENEDRKKNDPYFGLSVD